MYIFVRTIEHCDTCKYAKTRNATRAPSVLYFKPHLDTKKSFQNNLT